MKLRTILLCAALLAPLPVAAQEGRSALEQLDAQVPGTIINDPMSLDWPSQGTGFKKKGIVDPKIPGGGAAAQYAILNKGANPWDAGASIPLNSAIKRGEDITVGFWARSLAAETPDGQGTVTVRVQQNSAPWPGFIDQTVSIGRDWKWHEVTGSSTIDIPRGLAIVSLTMAHAKQTLEIGEMIVVKGSKYILTHEVGPSGGLELPPQLTGKGTLLNRAELRTGWTFNGPEASHTNIEDRNVYMRKATRFTVPAPTANPWDVAANVPIEDGINAGDQLLIAVTARTVSAATADGKAQVSMRVQNDTPPDYDGFLQVNLKPGSNWQLLQLKATAPKSIPAGKAVLALHFGTAQQVVEVGPVYVLKVPPTPSAQP